MELNKRTRIILLCIALVVIVAIVAAMANSCSRDSSNSGAGSEAGVENGAGTDLTAGSGADTESSAVSGSGSMSDAAESSQGNGDNSHSELNHALNGNDALGKYLTEQDSIMMGMMDEMLIREESGNASVDFLKGMIPHHEAAIEMSESYLKYGGEKEELKTIAKDIISAQEDEIKQMNDLLKSYEEEGKTDPEKEKEYLAKYSEMFSQDSKSHHINPEGVETIDQAFAEGMIMHHEMAIHMAKDILEYTDYEEIRTLAEGIIKVQEEEIQKMQKLAES